MESSKSSETKGLAETGSTICCLRFGAIVLAGLIFAYLIDLADFTFMFAMFLMVSGLLRGTAAAIAADAFWGRELNRWDEAGMLIVLGLLVYWIGALTGSV